MVILLKVLAGKKLAPTVTDRLQKGTSRPLRPIAMKWWFEIALQFQSTIKISRKTA